MINHLPKVATISLLLFASSCSDNVNTSNLPQTQKQFCNIINKYKALYQAIEDKDKYIDQETELASIFNQRKNALKEILKDGQVEKWSGVIDDMSIGGKGVYIKIQLPWRL